MHTPQQKHDGGTLPLLLGAALTAAATAIVPAGLLIAPALFAYAMCRTRPVFLVLFGGVYAILSFLTTDALTAGSLSVLCIGAALALCFMQKNKTGNAYTALALLCIALFALYAIVCLPGILSGAGAFAAIQASVDELVAAMREALEQTASTMPTLPPAFSERIDSYLELLEAFRKTASSLVVPVLCIMAGGLSLSNLLLFRLFAKGRVQGLAPMRPFRLWAIPKSMTYGLLALLLASLVLLWTGWEFADSLSATVNVLVGMPLALQGLCVADYLIVRSKRNVAVKRTFLCIGTILLFQLVQSLFMMLGCFDQLFHLRARAEAAPPAMPRGGF